MDLENIMLREISQPEKDKYHMVSHICGIQWKNRTNKPNRSRCIDREQDDREQQRLVVEGLSKKEKGSWTRTTAW